MTARRDWNEATEYNGIEFDEDEIEAEQESVLRDAARFRALRSIVGASTEDVAEEMSVRNTAVRRWERGVGYIPAAAWALLETWYAEREDMIIEMTKRQIDTGRVAMFTDMEDKARQRRVNAAAESVIDMCMVEETKVEVEYADMEPSDASRMAALKSLWFKSRESATESES